MIQGEVTPLFHSKISNQSITKNDPTKPDNRYCSNMSGESGVIRLLITDGHTEESDSLVTLTSDIFDEVEDLILVLKYFYTL